MGDCISICFERASFDIEPTPPSPQDPSNTITDATIINPLEKTINRWTIRNAYFRELDDNPYMGHPRRGLAVIFNHEKFDPSVRQNRREGTHVDGGELSKVLKELEFDVEVHDDFTKTEIEKRLQEVSAMDHSDCDCLMVAVMTHGIRGDNLYAYDGLYSCSALWAPFVGDKCASLVGKPKIFIIQACRGDCFDYGTRPQEQPKTQYVTDGCQDKTIPVMADLFIAYSSYEGYVSWRDTENGSWFIQELCKCLREYHEHLDLQRIMTRVCQRVATTYESQSYDVAEYKKLKQMPSIHSSLLHEVYF